MGDGEQGVDCWMGEYLTLRSEGGVAGEGERGVGCWMGEYLTLRIEKGTGEGSKGRACGWVNTVSHLEERGRDG